MYSRVHNDIFGRVQYLICLRRGCCTLHSSSFILLHHARHRPTHRDAVACAWRRWCRSRGIASITAMVAGRLMTSSVCSPPRPRESRRPDHGAPWIHRQGRSQLPFCFCPLLGALAFHVSPSPSPSSSVVERLAKCHSAPTVSTVCAVRPAQPLRKPIPDRHHPVALGRCVALPSLRILLDGLLIRRIMTGAGCF